MRKITILLSIAILLILAACAKPECTTTNDCISKPTIAFTSKCVNEKCVYEPKPNVCGNEACETGENKANCETDCGKCQGKVPGTQYTEYTLYEGQCLEGAKSTQIYTSTDTTSFGDKFKIETTYNNPFNLKKDTFNIKITLTQQTNTNIKIQAIELTATTKGRPITLTRQPTNKPIWKTDQPLTEQLTADFPADREGELTNIALKIQYDYTTPQGATKQATLQNNYKEKIIYVNPAATYPCPNCDDENPATTDTCENGFCKHQPIPNTCGNYKCDQGENKCTCSQDCGYCEGPLGKYLEYTCQQNICNTIINPQITIQQNNILDERNIGPILMTNNYIFTNPITTQQDIELKFSAYLRGEDITEVIIEQIRLLEGQQELTKQELNKDIAQNPLTVKLRIPQITQPEQEKQITLAVWYRYKQAEKVQTGTYQKILGKLTIIKQ